MSDFMEQLKEIAKNNKALAKQKIYFRNEFNTYGSKLTKLQKSLIFFALSSIKKEDRNLSAFELSQKPFLIKVQDFLTICNIDPKKQKNIYKDIETAILELQKKPITYQDKYKAIHNISWFTKTSYYSKESIRLLNNDLNEEDYVPVDENSYYLLYFTSEITNHLVNLKSNFMSYSFLISHNFDNKYSARIYELLQEHKNLIRIEIPMEDFIRMLALPKSYMVRSQLKHYVLEKVKEDINGKLPKFGFNHDFEDNKVILMRNEGMIDDYFFNEINEIKKMNQSNKKVETNDATDTSSNSTTSITSTSSLLDNVKEKEQEKGQAVTFKEDIDEE